ncbi:PREDICTED: uncharacterized protein LOC104736263 [Camelina sativa]|uniref:Uncharacterized protein LOC104736263 n=1 Tax=Camelina sativa TaxID=90675 RepID=A0ABM0VDF0_CAMSA|nr:PREDICTED: uncharacterized protein LOC104736263 [Camelina sativa]
MSTGCLSCFKKKQSKKKDKPVKTERLRELPVGEKEDVEEREVIQQYTFLNAERLPMPKPVEKKETDVKCSAYKKKNEEDIFRPEPGSRWSYCSLVGSSDVEPKVNEYYGDHYTETDASSSSMNNEFNKVKTFDIRGVKVATPTAK